MMLDDIARMEIEGRSVTLDTAVDGKLGSVFMDLTLDHVLRMSDGDYTVYQMEVVSEWAALFRQKPDYELQFKLICEEVLEAIRAIQALDAFPTVPQVAHMLKELADVQFTVAGFPYAASNLQPSDRVPAQQALASFTAMLDMLVPHVDRAIHRNEWDMDAFALGQRKAFYQVLQSNLSKLGDDGKPIFDHAGKIMKGPNYVEPMLNDIAEDIIMTAGKAKTVH